MIEERGSAYSINEDTVFIQNAWGVAEIQKVYTIFRSVEVLDLINFVDKNPLGSLQGMKYIDLMKEIQEKFENIFKNIDLKKFDISIKFIALEVFFLKYLVSQ